jgi:hypothetical protein
MLECAVSSIMLPLASICARGRASTWYALSWWRISRGHQVVLWSLELVICTPILGNGEIDASTCHGDFSEDT